MEAVVASAPNYDGLANEFGQFAQDVKSEAGENMILEQNMFSEGILPMSIMRKLEDKEMAEYRRPTLTRPRQIQGTCYEAQFATWLEVGPTYLK